MFRGSVDTALVEEATGDTAQGWLGRLTWQAFWRKQLLAGKAVAFLCVCPTQDPSRNQAVLGTVFLMLAVFVALYVLVYVECLVRRWLRASALLIWACLVTLGYVLVFDSWRKAACASQQVRGQGTPATLAAGCLQPAVHLATLALSGHWVPSGEWACISCAGLGPFPAGGLQQDGQVLLSLGSAFLCVVSFPGRPSPCWGRDGHSGSRLPAHQLTPR